MLEQDLTHVTTSSGRRPVDVSLWQVSLRIEKWCRDEKHHENTRLQELSAAFPERISEQVCNSAAQMANKLAVETIFVYTRRGLEVRMMKSGDLVIAVSDITSNNLSKNLQSIQVRRIP
ncbi:hypothetical protein R1sor_023482 [Riccia sorocarpa]|uniref:PPM-type phosphatase domain-containing protein n=1 Tax=Riccia sorocarpa TaxID=122646 RepID=A0ABD3GPB4_9MARC